MEKRREDEKDESVNKNDQLVEAEQQVRHRQTDRERECARRTWYRKREKAELINDKKSDQECAQEGELREKGKRADKQTHTCRGGREGLK